MGKCGDKSRHTVLQGTLLIVCLFPAAFLCTVLGGCGRTSAVTSFDSSTVWNSTDSVYSDAPVADNRNEMIDEGSCLTDDDCQDGLVCNGRERCAGGRCAAGEPMRCDDGDDCTIGSCSEEAGGCVALLRDGDGDGFGDEACGGDDCDDAEADIHPGAPEGCGEGEDRDCSGTPDLDDDGDGYLDSRCPGGDDCNDRNPNAFPGAAEVCFDGEDQDCDGLVDGPQFMLPSDGVLLSDSWISMTSMCWTGSEYGVAWAKPSGMRSELYFARVDGEGTVSSHVVETQGDASSPTLVWMGSEFALGYGAFVCWFTSYPPSEGCGGIGARFRRLSGDGAVISEEVRLTADGDNPHMAWTGSDLGLAWEDRIGAQECIYFKKISPLGEGLSDEVLVPASCDDRGYRYPRVVWTGSEFGIVWIFSGDLYFHRMSAEAAVLDDTSQVTSGGSVASIPGFAWTGSEYGITWEDEHDYGERKIYFTRVSAEGVKVGEDLLLANSDLNPGSPTLAWAGGGYFLLWCEGGDSLGDLLLTYLTPEGIRINDDVRMTEVICPDAGSYPLSYPSIGLVWTGSELGVSWNHYDAYAPLNHELLYFNRIGFCD
jgi:hypothetical protein